MKQRQHHLLIMGLWLVGATTAAALAARLIRAIAQPQAALALTTASRLFVTAQSPGAIAVGAAEGNLTPTGEITGLYYGHIDPGNHVTNRGFCSWNGAAHLTVAEANQRCLLTLQQHAAITEQRLRGLSLPSNDPAAVVNGTDLWNQSDQAGPQFASKYQQALAQGLSGSKALLTARVEAFRDSAGQLDAGGLFGICRREPFYRQRLTGLTQGSEAWRWHCIALDQGRRVGEVARALTHNLGLTVVVEESVSRLHEEDATTSTNQPTTSVNLSFSPGAAPSPRLMAQTPTRSGQPEEAQSISSPPSESLPGALNFTPGTEVQSSP